VHEKLLHLAGRGFVFDLLAGPAHLDHQPLVTQVAQPNDDNWSVVANTWLLAPNLANPEVAEHFPRYGWAETREGFGVLVVPVVRLIRQVDMHRTQNGLPERGQNPEQRKRLFHGQAFEQTLRRLTGVLRELAELRRIASELGSGWEETDSSVRERINSTWEGVAIHLDMALVYLRRLANHLVGAIAPCLLDHYDQCSTDYRDFRSSIAKDRHSVAVDPCVPRQGARQGAPDSLCPRSSCAYPDG
jgi:hypothetical protein